MENINQQMMVEALTELADAADVDPEAIAGVLGFEPDDLLKVAGMLAYTETVSGNPSDAHGGPAVVVAVLLGFVLGEDRRDLSNLAEEAKVWRDNHPADDQTFNIQL